MTSALFSGWTLSEAIEFTTDRFTREPWTGEGMAFLGDDPFTRGMNFGKLEREHPAEIHPRKDAFRNLRAILQSGRLAAGGVLGGGLGENSVLIRPEQWDLLNFFDEDASAVGLREHDGQIDNSNWFYYVRIYPILESPYRLQFLRFLRPEQRTLGQILDECVWTDPELSTIWRDDIHRKEALINALPSTLSELPAVHLRRDGEAMFGHLVNANMDNALNVPHPRNDKTSLQFFDVLAGRLSALGELIGGGEVGMTGIPEGGVHHERINSRDIETGDLLLHLPTGWLYRPEENQPAFTDVRLVVPAAEASGTDATSASSIGESVAGDEDDVPSSSVADFVHGKRGRKETWDWDEVISNVLGAMLSGNYRDAKGNPKFIRSMEDFCAIISDECKAQNGNPPGEKTVNSKLIRSEKYKHLHSLIVRGLQRRRRASGSAQTEHLPDDRAEP